MEIMKEVKLRMKEQYKYDIIKELVDHNGNRCSQANDVWQLK